MVLVHLALIWALQAPKAPPQKAPPPLHNPLIVPSQDADLSAFRLDVEIFGWNKAFTEVGAVAMEMVRDREGAHRGETYLLVYPTRSTTPKHNVICHFITHVALPHNPVPLEVAGDYMWTIEWSYQNMWPRRPKHKRPKGGMEVTPLWAPMPTHTAAADAVDGDGPGKTHARAHGHAPLKQHRSGGSCEPWVGFRLKRGKEVRLHPYRPVDLRARCDLIALTDSRTYWGTPDVAASMVRFDFNAAPKNEESARFVVSALWQEGKQLRFVLRPANKPVPEDRISWNRLLQPWGTVRWARSTQLSEAQGRPAAENVKPRVRAHTQWLPLARALMADRGHGDAPFEADDGLGETIEFVWDNQAPKTGATPNAEPMGADPAGAELGGDGAPKTPSAPSPEPPSRYLQDFKVVQP